MNKRKILGFLVLLSPIIFCWQAPAFADVPYQVPGAVGDLYYGHVSLVDIKNDSLDPVVIRAGKNVPEKAVLNFPIAPGDTIITSAGRRCEIQFDTGTVLRLDFDTELKVETILAQTLTSPAKASNLVLSKGRIYIMFRAYDHQELFQIMTRTAAVKIASDSVLMVKVTGDGFTDVQVKSGKAWVLSGASAASAISKKVGKLERLIVSNDNQSQPASYVADTDFELWNNEVNANFMALHKGKSMLPKPVMRFSPGIVYFAQKYSNIYGEWIWDDLYGYVWRPFYNDYYPWGSWQPFIYGRWSEAQGQMFWVPEEPWGWVPYHLGIWTWDAKLGWVWLPGSLFAPAWVDWAYMRGYYVWGPWSLWDWMLMDMWDMRWYGFYDFYDYLLDSWLMASWGYTGHVPLPPSPPSRTITTSITKDQLTPPQTPQSLRDFSRAQKRALGNIEKALKRSDERVLLSLQGLGRSRAFVKPEDIHSRQIQFQLLRLDQLPDVSGPQSFRQQFFEKSRSQNPALEAARDFNANRDALPPRTVALARTNRAFFYEVEVPPGVPDPASRMASGADRQPRTGPAPASSRMRFRDWNPDVRVALREGVTITYSSLSNEIRCPQLGLSSRDVVMQSHSGGGSHGMGSHEPGSFGGASSTSSHGASSSSSSSSSHESPSSTSSSHSGGTHKD